MAFFLFARAAANEKKGRRFLFSLGTPAAPRGGSFAPSTHSLNSPTLHHQRVSKSHQSSLLDTLFLLPKFIKHTGVRLTVRAQDGAAAPAAPKPQIGPKRGSKVSVGCGNGRGCKGGL